MAFFFHATFFHCVPAPRCVSKVEVPDEDMPLVPTRHFLQGMPSLGFSEARFAPLVFLPKQAASKQEPFGWWKMRGTFHGVGTNVQR